MGTFAVNELLAGRSDIVICQRNGKIVSKDINYALNLDRLYKGKVTKEEMLEKFDEATVEKMCAEAAERRARIEWLYNVEQTISL